MQVYAAVAAKNSYAGVRCRRCQGRFADDIDVITAVLKIMQNSYAGVRCQGRFADDIDVITAVLTIMQVSGYQRSVFSLHQSRVGRDRLIATGQFYRL
ncbi:hypothetical protein J6590_086242 [Homalodisca vitripennis]|nr:hypothetical protein J6590_086242 [Homalodisca vitripennis]